MKAIFGSNTKESVLDLDNLLQLLADSNMDLSRAEVERTYRLYAGRSGKLNFKTFAKAMLPLAAKS